VAIWWRRDWHATCPGPWRPNCVRPNAPDLFSLRALGSWRGCLQPQRRPRSASVGHLHVHALRGRVLDALNPGDPEAKVEIGLLERILQDFDEVGLLVGESEDVDISGRPSPQAQAQLHRYSALEQEPPLIVIVASKGAEQHLHADPATQAVRGDAFIDAERLNEPLEVGAIAWRPPRRLEGHAARPNSSRRN
jgi:hypothetical protein